MPWLGTCVHACIRPRLLHRRLPNHNPQQVAVLVLHRCLTGLPSKRDQLVSSMASFCVRLPDDLPEV